MPWMPDGYDVIYDLVPYATLTIALMVVFATDLALLSLMRWTGGVFIVAGLMMGVVG